MGLAQAKENIRSIYNELFGEKTDHPFIARFLAFLVDYALFLTAGSIIHFVVNSTNRLSILPLLIIQLVLCTIYFTLGNSKIFGGQTIGKKLLRIRTIGSEGNYLGLTRSVIRSVPVVLLMNSFQIMQFVVMEQDSFTKIVLVLLTSILLGATYFPLFKLNRQTLHDLLVSSQVVPRDRKIRIEKKINLILILGFVAIMVGYSIYIFTF
jgi:uncharacterized RDD family membrane protein YckC